MFGMRSMVRLICLGEDSDNQQLLDAYSDTVVRAVERAACPAQRAGAPERDIIVGRPSCGVGALHRWLVKEAIGVALPLLVRRGSERLELSVVPIDQPPT
jgi:hypothetical protein